VFLALRKIAGDVLQKRAARPRIANKHPYTQTDLIAVLSIPATLSRQIHTENLRGVPCSISSIALVVSKGVVEQPTEEQLR
jgi:hypothetical protein